MPVLKFSERVNKVKPSFTLEMTSRAADLRANGIDVINLSVGEPDFNTPNHIIEAAKKEYESPPWWPQKEEEKEAAEKTLRDRGEKKKI